MALRVEIPYLPKDINLHNEVIQRFHGAKNFVNQSVNSLSESAQQVRESWKETATQATDQAVNAVTTTLGQAKASVEQTLQSAEQIKSTTSAAVQTAIDSSVSNWFEQHPAVFQLVQILGWAANHPIISLVILVFAVAILWNIIKAIARLVERASLSLLQVPFKLLQAFVKVSFRAFTQFGNLAVKKLKGGKKTAIILALPPATSQQIHQDKQQRLAEISYRLEEIQKEQNLLLQEAAELLASDTIDIKMPVKLE